MNLVGIVIKLILISMDNMQFQEKTKPSDIFIKYKGEHNYRNKRKCRNVKLNNLNFPELYRWLIIF